MNYAGKFGSGGLESLSNAHVDLDSLSHRGHADAVTVPDAHLLFSGDFHKSGPDLIISDQFHRVVVPDYFRGEKHPTLISPNGAPLDPKVVDALTGHTEYAQAGGAPAAKVVGHVVKMTGSASVVRNGVTVDVQNGDAVYQSDVVQTGSGSTLGLVLNDGTTFNLSAGARLMLNDLTYDASSTSNSSLFTLVQGAANFVAGQVAKTGDMKVATPVATMGIRGTAVVLDIDSVDGKVSISVVDQHDGQIHAVAVFNTQGVQIGTVTSNGTTLTLTPTANFNVIAQESNKTPAQIAQEFAAFQAALDTYNLQKAIDPNLPQHTDNGGNNANPQTKFTSLGSTPASSPGTEYHAPAGTYTVTQTASTTPGTTNFTVASIDTGSTGTPPVETPTPATQPPTSPPFVVTPPTVSPITSGEGNHTNPVMSASGDVVYDPDGIVYFYDRASGVTTRVTPANDGFTYSGQTISSDGRYVAYQGTDGTHTYVYIWGTDPSDTAHYHVQTLLAAGGSPAISGDGSTILVEQAGGSIGIFDLQGHSKGTITPASVGASGALSNPAISADGHVIAFWSSDTANPGGAEHLYTYNVSTGEVTEIASSAGGGAPAASISADGHYVVYQSHAAGGHTEISLYDVTTGQVVYSTASAHEILAGDSKNPVISPDGHFIIFTSTAQLTPGDTNSYADTYVVDVTNPNSPVYTLISEHGDAPSDSGVAISAGGLFVAFGSSASFYTGSTGGNIFVADPTSGRTAIIQETASSPDHLTANGVIGITGGSTDVTLTVTDLDGHPTNLLTAGLSADGKTIEWHFSEAKSDFASLHYGEDLAQHFLITLNYPSGTTSIPVIVGVHDAVQPVVTPVDVAPVANPVTLADGQENHSYLITPDVLLAHVGDIDGPQLAITDVSVKTGGGSLVHNDDGSWTYTPAEGFHGQVVFNYTASDGTLTSTSTASLDLVVPIDQPPVAAPVTLPAGTEDASYTVSASSLLAGVTDPDGPSLSITSVSVASGGGNLVDNHDGTWTYTPAPGYAGSVSFNYTASDGTLSASSTANLTLAPETAIAPTLTVGANVTFVPTDGAALETSLNLHAGDVVTFQWNFTTDDYLPYKDFAFASVNGAAFLLSDIQSTGSYGSTGWHTFSYTATADGTYNIGAGVMNDKDTAVLSYLAVDNIEVNGTVVQSFENGLAGSTALGNVSVVASAHSQVNPNPILPTDGSMEAFLTSDPILESQIESFLGLAPGRLAGVGQSEGPEHTAIIVPITVSVAGNTHPDETYVTISGAPAGSVFNHGVYNSENDTWHIDAADLGGNLTITTPPGYFGSFTLSVTATSVVEGSHTSATTAAQTQVVIVDPVYPVATAVTLADGTEDTPYTIHASDLLAGASDLSGASLSISAVDITSGGGTIVDNHDGTWTYTPAQDHNGAVSFSYTASDGILTSSSTASLTLAAVDDAPVATPVVLTSGAEDTTYTIHASDLLAHVTDVDSPLLSITAMSVASGGGSVVDNHDGTFTYAPALHYEGPVSFNYTASDGSLTSTSTASLTLAPTVTTLTFDDLPSSDGGSPIPNGYGGLDWSNFDLADPSGNPGLAGSGYVHGTVSAPNVAFNAYAMPASISGATFNFVGADLTGAWNDGLSVTVDGYYHNVLVHETTVVVNSTAPTWFEFDFDGITELVLSSHGGTSAGYGGRGEHFAMDNFTFTMGPPNEAPVFTGHDLASTYTPEGDAVPLVDTVLVGDIDSANYADGTLTATVTDGGHEGDTLVIADNDHITLNGNAVMFDADGTGDGHAVAIGTLSDHINSLTVDLNANADDAAVAALAQAIEFENAKDDSAAGTRTVTFTLHDGGGTGNGGYDSASFTAHVQLDQAPVISVDELQVSQNDNGTTTVSGLVVTDADATAGELFTITAATAGAGSGTTVSPASGSGHLADIKATLESGVTYDQGDNPPATDRVTLTVADAHGAADTVNLIFNVADDPVTPVTLAGTTGKDVFFGTGNADQFVFAAQSNHDTIMNFTHGQDHINLSAVVTSDDAANWFSQHVAAVPNSNDVLITIDAADTIRLHNPVGTLSPNDFILHTA